MGCTTAERQATRNARKSAQFTGYVGAALVTDRGSVYTGINLSMYCGIGFCAEHSAVAEMVRSGETRISRIVATTAEGKVIPPCGRCRELLYQIDESNAQAAVIVGEGVRRSLRELLPDNRQACFDRSL